MVMKIVNCQEKTYGCMNGWNDGQMDDQYLTTVIGWQKHAWIMDQLTIFL